MNNLFFLVFLFSCLSAGAQSKFDLKIKETVKLMTCPQPDERSPVTLSAQSVNEGDSVAIILKVSMAPGWHIYAYVPPTLPYIAIDQILRLTENVKAVGEWRKTEPEASSSDPGVLIYEDDALFIHKAIKTTGFRSNEVIKTGLYYQTCNLRQCLPPEENIIELKIPAEK